MPKKFMPNLPVGRLNWLIALLIISILIHHIQYIRAHYSGTLIWRQTFLHFRLFKWKFVAHLPLKVRAYRLWRARCWCSSCQGCFIFHLGNYVPISLISIGGTYCLETWIWGSERWHFIPIKSLSISYIFLLYLLVQWHVHLCSSTSLFVGWFNSSSLLHFFKLCLLWTAAPTFDDCNLRALTQLLPNKSTEKIIRSWYSFL